MDFADADRRLIVILLDQLYQKLQEGGEAKEEVIETLSKIYPELLLEPEEDIGRFARFQKVDEDYLEQIEVELLDLIEKIQKE